MAKANGVRWYGHVIRRDDDMKKAMMMEVNGKRKRERPKLLKTVQQLRWRSGTERLALDL